jgi:uncharacterized hydrophobic protein (TIGR00271 family)
VLFQIVLCEGLFSTALLGDHSLKGGSHAMNAQSHIGSRMSPQGTAAKLTAIRESVASGTLLNSSYLAMNLAAALIAGFGLMENSPAVIIGAMLIAMLYGPIVGIAFGLAEANLHLLRRSLLSEAVGALLVLAAGLLIGISTRDLTIGSEILSRTSPNLLDLLIALVGGLAGGLTFVSTGLSGVVVGVAIATALVPPLTTCGILLARELPNAAAGAFLLFLANFTAIALGAMIVFLLAGHRPAAADKVQKVLAPRLVCLALVLLLAFHLNGTLRRTSAQSIMQSNIRKALAQEIARIPGARLVDVTLVQRDGKTTAWAVARTPEPISPEQVARLNDIASNTARRDISLIVRSVITAETTRYGNVYEPEVHPDEDLNDR